MPEEMVLKDLQYAMLYADGFSRYLAINNAIEEIKSQWEQNKKMKSALVDIRDYLQEMIEVCESPGTKQTLEIHLNIIEAAL